MLRGTVLGTLNEKSKHFSMPRTLRLVGILSPDG